MSEKKKGKWDMIYNLPLEDIHLSLWTRGGTLNEKQLDRIQRALDLMRLTVQLDDNPAPADVRLED